MTRSVNGPTPCVDLEGLAAMVRERRGDRGMREVAAEIGVSAATVCRVENGRSIDLWSFAYLCAWLGVSADRFVGVKAAS